MGEGKNNDTFYLHKTITGNEDGRKYVVHHKNKNTLDNRKYNLEIVPYIVNVQLRDGANENNNTGVRNVSYIERTNEYWVQITKNYIRQKWIFPITQFKEACEFARLKRIELFGEE